MKNFQTVLLTGYVTLIVQGNQLENFFKACNQEQVTLWNLERLSENTCVMNVKLKDVPVIKRIGQYYQYELQIKNEKGIPKLLKLLIRRKELMIAFLLSILFIFILSNLIWSVDIHGVSKETEQKITDRLHTYGVYPGGWTFMIDSPSLLQERLLNDIPELLWIGVERKGTSYTLEGVEHILVEEDEPLQPQHLIAKKNAVIHRMYVKNGLSQVKINDFVQKGDLLVSGKMTKTDEIDDNNDEIEDIEYVAAEAEITGKTWYEVDVTVPLEGTFEKITGDYEERKYLQIGSVKIPFTMFHKPSYRHYHVEKKENQPYFLSWQLPFVIGKTTFHQKVYDKIKRTDEEAKQMGIKQAIQELKQKLGPNIEILSENVLQETKENGKVNLTLFFTVAEDIVKKEPISQGD